MSASRPTFYRSPRSARKRRRDRRGVLFAALAVVAVVYVLVGSDTGWWAVRTHKHEVDTLGTEVGDVQRRTEELRQATQELQERGSARLEKVAREQYLMSRPGERVLHVLEETAPEESSGSR